MLNGLLAIRNISQYKNRYIAIIMSLTISIALTIASSYYVTNILNNIYESDYNYEIYVEYSNGDKFDMIEKMLDDIEQANIADRAISITNNYIYSLIVDENNISQEEKEFYKKISTTNSNFLSHYKKLDNFNNKYYTTIQVITLNDDIYNNYLKELNIEKLEKNECILIDYLNENTKYYNGIKITNYKDGDIAKISNATASINDLNATAQLNIKKVTKKLPKEIVGVEKGPIIIGNKDIIENLNIQMFGMNDKENLPKNYSILLKINDLEKTNKFVENLKESFNSSSDTSSIVIYGQEKVSKESIEAENLLRNIFVYSFIGIITLASIFNIYNTINTSLEGRKRDIIRLISIGIEQKQINKIIFFENMVCGILSLTLGITLGITVAYIVFIKNINYTLYSFKVPWMSIMIVSLSIIVIVILSSLYYKKKLLVKDYIEILKENSLY